VEIFADHIQQGKSKTGDYYCSLLTKGKLSKATLFLQDNAPACCRAAI
jgi:hypothetical protein